MHETTLREVSKVKAKYTHMSCEERRAILIATQGMYHSTVPTRSLSGIGRACGDVVTVVNESGRLVDLWIVEERLMHNPGDADAAVAFAINAEGDVVVIESRRL
jgi:hypothetical protein